MLDLGGGKESVSNCGDVWMGLPVSKMSNRKPNRFWSKIMSYVLLHV